MKTLTTVCVLFCFVSSLSLINGQAWSRSQLTVKDHGYEGLLIAIHKDVEENEQIINYIKEIFTDASQALYSATRQRLYFKDITILVPLTWERRTQYKVATDETFDRANVRVDKPHPANGDAPYVQQVEGCGKAGEYLHLTPKYVLDRKQSEYYWGPAEWTMLHEWGHLRWGLFDEYTTSDDGNDHFYVDRRKLLPVRCNNKVKGWPMNPTTQGKCQIDRQTLQVDKACRFVPDMNGNEAKASVMFMQFLDTVKDFCDNGFEEDNEIIHNPMAPNGQNKFCGGRSTWEILRNHTDFKDLKPKGGIDTKPTFTLVQPGYTRTCLVMDVSGSMGFDSPQRIESLRQAAQKYILSTVQTGSFISLVEFTFTGTITQELMQVNDQSRQTIVNNLPQQPGGGTSIQDGIMTGLEALQKGEFGIQKGGRIMLITDGVAPDYQNATGDAKAQQVIIDTIAISNAADPRLQETASKTGGLSFFYSPGSGSTQLNDAMDKIADRDFVGKGEPPITITSKVITMAPNSKSEEYFKIDKFVTDTGTITFSYNTDIDVKITDPSGKMLSDAELQTQKDTTFKTITMTLKPPIKIGKWTYTIQASNETAIVNVNIRAKPSSKNEVTIKVTSSIDVSNVNFSPTSVVRIFASVTKGYAPVIGALVEAVIGRPTGTDYRLDLFDNGVGSDIKKNDGIYSGSFLPKNFVSNGHYSIKVEVKNNGIQTTTQAGRAGSGPMGIPGHYFPPEVTDEKEETGDFDRITTGGTFQVVDFNQNVANTDKFPPSRINDLKATSIDVQNLTMTLEWTAVGDDADQGKAHQYSLRVSQNTTSLRTSKGFLGATEVQMKEMLTGNLTDPKEPGNSEKMVVSTRNFMEKGLELYFSLVAIDKAGNMGEPSNLVYVVTEMPDLSVLDEQPSRTNIPLIVGLAVGGLFLIAVAVGGFVYFKSKQTKVLPL